MIPAAQILHPASIQPAGLFATAPIALEVGMSSNFLAGIRSSLEAPPQQFPALWRTGVFDFLGNELKSLVPQVSQKQVPVRSLGDHLLQSAAVDFGRQMEGCRVTVSSLGTLTKPFWNRYRGCDRIFLHRVAERLMQGSNSTLDLQVVELEYTSTAFHAVHTYSPPFLLRDIEAAFGGKLTLHATNEDEGKVLLRIPSLSFFEAAIREASGREYFRWYYAPPNTPLDEMHEAHTKGMSAIGFPMRPDYIGNVENASPLAYIIHDVFHGVYYAFLPDHCWRIAAEVFPAMTRLQGSSYQNQVTGTLERAVEIEYMGEPSRFHLDPTGRWLLHYLLEPFDVSRDSAKWVSEELRNVPLSPSTNELIESWGSGHTK